MDRALAEIAPVIFIQVLRASGALARILPELDNQSEQRLQQATLLTLDPKVRFAVLLSKESALKTLCQRLKVPNDYQSLAQLVIRYRSDYCRLPEMKAEEILTLFEHLDVFRRPQRAADFMVACLAEDQAHSLQALFEKALKSALSVNVQSVITQVGTMDGEAIKRALREARRSSIAMVKSA